MSHWKEYKLGDFVEIQTGPFGSLLHASDYVSEGTPSIMPTNIGSRLNVVTDNIVFINDKDLERLKKYTVKDGDIVYSRRGDVEKCALITKNEEGWLCGTGCLRIRVNRDDLIPQFCAYYLSTPEIKSWVLNSAVGTTMPNLNSSILNDLPLRLPEISIQSEISETLKSIDDKIAFLKRQNKTLEKLAETLFRQYFIEGTKEKWDNILLKNIYEFEKGFEPGSNNYLEEECPDSIRFIRVGDMNEKRSSVFIKRELANGKTCSSDDLLVSLDGTVGRVVFGITGCFSSGIRRIKSSNKIYDSLWLKHQIFISKEIQDEIEKHATGTVILHAGSSIDYLSIQLPSLSEIENLGKVIKPIYDKIQMNSTQITTLEKTFEILLTKFMNEEIRLKN